MAMKAEKARYRVYYLDVEEDWIFDAAFVHQEDSRDWVRFNNGPSHPDLWDTYRIMCNGSIVWEGE